MEAFDISNISGAQPVGSMVVFTDGRPRKMITESSVSKQ